MFIKVTRISIINCEIISDDLESLGEWKESLAAQLKVETKDIHLNFTEIEE